MTSLPDCVDFPQRSNKWAEFKKKKNISSSMITRRLLSVTGSDTTQRPRGRVDAFHLF